MWYKSPRFLHNLIAIGCMALALGLYLYTVVERGLLLTYDSKHYIHSANTFVQSGTFQMSDAKPLSIWPPLYPLILSLFGTSQSSLVFLHGILLFAACLLALKLGHSYLTNTSVQTVYVLSYCTALAVLIDYVFVWSESLFTPLFLAACILAREKPSIKNISLLTITTAMLCLTRYVGVPMSLLIWVYVACTQYHRLLAVTIGCGMSFLPIIGWMGRNHSLTGNWTGLREPAPESLLEILEGSVEVFLKWISPFSALSIVLLSFLLGMFIRFRAFSSYRTIILPLTVVVGYCVTILFSAYVNDSDYDERIFSPIYPIALLIMAYLFQQMLPMLTNWQQKSLYVLCSLWFVYSLLRSCKNIYFWFCVMRDF